MITVDPVTTLTEREEGHYTVFTLACPHKQVIQKMLTSASLELTAFDVFNKIWLGAFIDLINDCSVEICRVSLSQQIVEYVRSA